MIKDAWLVQSTGVCITVNKPQQWPGNQTRFPFGDEKWDVEPRDQGPAKPDALSNAPEMNTVISQPSPGQSMGKSTVNPRPYIPFDGVTYEVHPSTLREERAGETSSLNTWLDR